MVSNSKNWWLAATATKDLELYVKAILDSVCEKTSANSPRSQPNRAAAPKRKLPGALCHRSDTNGSCVNEYILPLTA